MKRMVAFISILVMFLIVAFFSENKHLTSQSQVRVGVLTLMHHPALDQIQEGFTAGLAEKGYHNGKNIQIDYQNAQGDQSNLKTMASKLVNENSNVVVGITTPASQALANATKKIPLVLGAVTDPKTAGLVKNFQHPGGNITGVSNLSPVAEQLRLIQEFMPHLQTLGVIYTSSDSSAVAEYKLIVKKARQLNISLKSYSISNSNDLNQVSQQMLQQVDAVIVPADNVIAGAMQTLVKNADAVNKPVFPAVDTMVKQGGVATYSINQYKLGIMGGHLTAALLKGQKQPATTPIEYVRHGDPVVNLKQARKLGIKVPSRFLHEAQSKGEVFK
ncbi:tryptophan ABC transporter substrate-binding protein [Bombilactobacillus bombi]|uniref:tryptophan ABC transporter substrate-binding protein n=1 Tax=Bombilactobacillus bombi TaxID=1303590 RepID=UPI0015E5A92A|nr:tryptophan ABC transporter substrate-binding protein [Bombilactobacillus bombi]MBA1433841.1 ABC transporter substrate-binding protein [Bombilactobacillus bombi]